MNGSEKLMMFLLKRYRPWLYRERQKSVAGKIDPPTWTDAQIEAYKNGVPLAQVRAMTKTDVLPEDGSAVSDAHGNCPDSPSRGQRSQTPSPRVRRVCSQ